MKRLTVALLAALDAALAVAIGIGVALVPLLALWALHFQLGIDPAALWRGAVDIWALGNGSSMRVTLDTALITQLGLPSSMEPFLVSLAPLAFTVGTVLFGVRTGSRAARSSWWQGAVVVSVGVFAVLSLLVALSALYPAVRPSIVQGTLAPTLRFAGGAVVAALWVRFREQDAADPVLDGLRALRDRFPDDWWAVLVTALRGGMLAAVALLGVAAVTTAIVIAAGYGAIISLHESAQFGALGGAVVTGAELLYLPNLVIWAASWITGGGFAIGTGTAISPIGTLVGPIPAVPVLGALPTGDSPFGFAVLVIPVVIGFASAVVLRRRLAIELHGRGGLSRLLVAGVGIGITAGVVLGVLAALSAGAAGPGRLIEVGPNAWATALWTAVVVGIAAVLGMAAGPVHLAEEDRLPDLHERSSGRSTRER
ncbi:cell division protein PerM [Plantibacter sp. RU18]|uniref:cell division protein PerM n=1 Tax=Plantibacter sp. RU18 TaxID=3158143 RepID=UPI003D35A51F